MVQIHSSFTPFEDITEIKLREFTQKWNEVEDSNNKLTTKLATVLAEGKREENHDKPDPEKKKDLKALEDIVESLHLVIPALKKSEKFKEEQSEKYAHGLFELLNEEAEAKKFKVVLGRSVTELHEKCHEIQEQFLSHANKTGLFEKLRKAKGDEDDLDEAEMSDELLQEENESDAFEALGGAEEEQERKEKPSLQGFIVLSKLFQKSICGNPTKGMIELLRKIVHGKEPSENPLPKLGDKVIEFLGLTDGPNIPCKERKGLLENIEKPPNSLKKKFLSIVLKTSKVEQCRDVPSVLLQLKIIKSAIQLTGKVHMLLMLGAKQKMDLVKQIKALMAHKQDEYAFKLVGDKVLEDLKKVLLIELSLKKQLPK